MSKQLLFETYGLLEDAILGKRSVESIAPRLLEIAELTNATVCERGQGSYWENLEALTLVVVRLAAALHKEAYDEGYAEGYLYGLSEGTGVDVFDLREMQQDGDL